MEVFGRDLRQVGGDFLFEDSAALAGLRTLRNYMDTAPGTQITVVALGEGVHFLKEGAKDKKNPNIEYGPLISDLVARGVKFEICELTLRALDLKKDQFVMDAGFTPTGVVRLGQLQYRERYGLKADYPMVSESYSQVRRDMAKKIGLGRKPGEKPGARKRTSTAAPRGARKPKAV